MIQVLFEVAEKTQSLALANAIQRKDFNRVVHRKQLNMLLNSMRKPQEVNEMKCVHALVNKSTARAVFFVRQT